MDIDSNCPHLLPVFGETTSHLTSKLNTAHPHDGRMDGQTDGRTDGRTDRRTDGGALQYLPSRAFGAAGDNRKL